MVAVAKKKKQHHKPESAAATLEDIQSRGDRLAEWIGQNPLPILGTAGAILGLAALVGLYSTLQKSSREAGSIALAEVRLDYRDAMGASPNAFEIPEPANPETAKRVREEYIGKFEGVADEYSGKATGSLALLEAGNLHDQLGDTQQAMETWKRALESESSGSVLRAIILERMAGAQEDLGDYKAAAASYSEASEIQNYPLRYTALVNAARCLAEAGDVEAAIAAYDRVETESPDLVIAPHTAARLRELRAAAAL